MPAESPLVSPPGCPGCPRRSRLSTRGPSAPQERQRGQRGASSAQGWPCWALGELCPCQGRAERHLWSFNMMWALDPLLSQMSSRRRGVSVPGNNFFHTFSPSSGFNSSVLLPSSHPSRQTRLTTTSTTMSTRNRSRTPPSSSSPQMTLTGLSHFLATAIPEKVSPRGGQGGEEGVKSQPCARSLGCQPALEMPASKGWVRRIVCSVLLCISLVRSLCFISGFHRMDSDHAEHFWLLLQKSTGLFAYRHCKM